MDAIVAKLVATANSVNVSLFIIMLPPQPAPRVVMMREDRVDKLVPDCRKRGYSNGESKGHE
ncbi:MAG: hypothetical protein C5B53_06005 [Candidatus Melainabacteria bacterium]|nr:MAG: hypothetical protein C5B53_06005 [Candidatus Melainabacteria bacterium]